MLTLDEAQQRILAGLEPLPSEELALGRSDRHILRQRADARTDLPHFDNSAMDGYALRSADVAAARSGRGVELRVVETLAAGSAANTPVTAGTCVRIFTGSPLSPGADAVVMQEDTQPLAGAPDRVLVFDPVKAGENIRRRGEDVRCGQLLVDAGQPMTPGRIALLGAVGYSTVSVGRQPRLGFLATGSELRSGGQPLSPGAIYESNRAALAALAARAGAIPRIYPLVPDEMAATRGALEQALAENDALITSGGVSVGAYDLVKPAFEGIGGCLDFWRVAIKPGKPFTFGRWRDRFLFGLPGNPVSAVVTFWLLVRPAIARWQGATDCSLPTQPGTLVEALTNNGDRAHFMRVALESGRVRLTGRQASHVLGSLSRADGLVEVPPTTTLAAGSAVTVLVWE